MLPHDQKIAMRVRILVQNWDYYFEEEFDPDPPSLSHEGLAYYVVYGEPSERGEYHSRSRTCLSIGEAMSVAEATVQQRIQWEV
jgi:hypothetical protein